MKKNMSSDTSSVPVPGDAQRIELQERIVQGRAAIALLKTTLRDQSMKDLLRRASFALDDAEVSIRSAVQARTPFWAVQWFTLASVEVEAAWRRINVIQTALESYGPDVRVLR
jgi:hypothetical protein